MPDKTVVYYTSNMDYPSLEEHVRQTIRDNAGDLPIVSVSQKPLDFGENICVGEIGRSVANVYMQMRMGVEKAKTKFVIVCEADFLYPKKWFEFNPERSDTYYYPREAWLAYASQDWYYAKLMHQLTGIVDREHLIGVIGRLQSGDLLCWPHVMYTLTRVEEFDAGPVVTVKTDRQMHARSPHSERRKTATLPEWGPWTSFVEKHLSHV